MGKKTASMKRYFTCATQPGTHDSDSEYHWMSLPGGGFVIVMLDGELDPHPDWNELPHLADPDRAPAYFDGIQHQLGTPGTQTASVTPTGGTFPVTTPAVSAQVTAVTPSSALSGLTNTSGLTALAGVQISDTTFQVAKKLAAINRHFHP